MERMALLTIVTSVFCLLVAGTVWGGAAGPGGDVLVFSRDGWVWRCSGNGDAQERLFEGRLPAVSPDAQSIAFFRQAQPSDAAEAFDLWVHDTMQGGERRIAESFGTPSAPVWTGDGSGLAFLTRDAQSRTSVVALRRDGSGRRTVFAETEAGSGFLCSLSSAPDGTLLVHDMVQAYVLEPGGEVRERIPLDRIMGREAAMVTSSDRLVVCPTDPGVLVFSHSSPGTARFERVMHEPSSALSLHDRWTGVGKNMRITPREVTAFDPVWSRDGGRVYFTGYKDSQAAEADLFRIFRVDRFGSGLKELLRGEDVSVGHRTGSD